MPTLETPNYRTGANLPTTAPGGDTSTREKPKDAQTYDVEDSDSEPEPDKEASDGAARAESPMVAHIHQMFSERLDAMQSMVERLPGVAPPIRKRNPDSYADTPFTDEITLIEMPRKFSFPSIKAIPTAISAFKRSLLPDEEVYKELTKYQCKTMEDVLSPACAQVKWEEDFASHAKAQQKQDPKTIRPDQTERDEKPSQRQARDSGNRNRGRYQNRPIEKAEGMAVSTWPDISHISVSRPELVNALRQMGQQVKWPQKMKAPDSFRNPGFWCDFHRDHSHKTEDCVALKIKVYELLRKGHLREFLSEKAKSHLSKETTGKPTDAAPISPP
ncbi:hypothetical protein F2Q68_00004998 [Brassica cretica]|uniref:Retrotransposon gag domain-containing protein n=1 Tax=Brassica cretica TaxID=69181 RepID=A0A8S9J8K9_BRACR|nr:hypothetical protein F2Q68_00004998 [Brassica cretica]